jgi:diguanylate cyclase (GGDEF)-like protein
LLDNEIAVNDDAVSRRHARIERGSDGWFVVDVGSRNGTLLNDRALAGQRTLKRDDRIKVGSTILKYLSGTDIESSYLEEIYQLGIVDHMTGVHNRRYLDEAILREFSRALRHGRALALLMIDVDRFKAVNDHYGHPIGDLVLQAVARDAKSKLGREATLARFGGEEFAVLLHETDLDGARRVAETLRAGVEALEVPSERGPIRVTVSIGAAALELSDRAADAIVRRADAALYLAKSSGRNCVAG